MSRLNPHSNRDGFQGAPAREEKDTNVAFVRPEGTTRNEPFGSVWEDS